jgi:hypothetical protein
VRLFVDRDLGKKLGRSLRAIGVPTAIHDERYPQSPAETVPDTLWILEATKREEIILSRDGGLARRRTVEIQAIVNAGGRCFVLETGNASAIDYLRAVMAAWPRIVDIVATESPPFVFGINRDGRVTRRYPPARV